MMIVKIVKDKFHFSWTLGSDSFKQLNEIFNVI